ncbi:permease-like cell division protein FtsX [Ravibacter arvi]|uniref:Cell division protein FtsX n=1 Tax=Ravibacter arvi TaxID=2051041 RepID=A0ABP8LZK4_9BACT
MAKKKKIGSYPNTMIVVSLTAALFLIGFCGLLVIQSRKLVSLIKQNLQVTVFVEKDLPVAGRNALYKEIADKPFVLKGIDSSVVFVSKEQAAKEFIEGTKEDFTTLLGENPLLDSYRVKIDEEYFNEEKLKAIQGQIERMKGVHEVVYHQDLADQINRNIAKIYMVLAAFAIIMLVIIVLLINNTIKLAIYSQRFLIRSMQLVGATDAFIQKPFLVHGALQGAIGGIIASVFLVILQQGAVRNIEGLIALQEYSKLGILLVGVILLGILVGLVCTFQSLSRYLRISLDELY